MLWRQSSIDFAAEDVQILVSKAIPALEESLKEPVYTTDDEVPALITQSHLKREVENLLRESTDTLDTTTIATQLKVSKSCIDTVIKEAAESTESYFDGLHVLPRHRVAAIGESLLNRSQIQKLSDICHEESITLKAATYAVKLKSPQLMIVGKHDYVVPEKLLETHVKNFETALAQASVPTKLSSIESDPVLLQLIKFKLGFPEHQDDYLPTAFVSGKRQEATNQLAKSGYVSSADIKQIEDPAKFAKAENAVVLANSWVVSRDFIASQKQELTSKLNSQGYVDLRDTAIYPQLPQYILQEDNTLAKYVSAKYPKTYLVKPSLEKRVLENVVKALDVKAETAANELSLEVSGSSTISDFVKEAKLPSLVEVSALVSAENEDIPVELKIPDHILPQARQAYSEKYSKVLQPRLEQSIEKLESKIRCYLNAVTSIPETAELRTLAWDEWQQYVSEQQFSVPANAKIAQQQFKVSEKLVQETVDELRSRAISRLAKLKNKAKEAALILHLSSTIYHSKHFCEEPGFLKVRGKAVPKLIKQFPFPESFNQLRTQLKDPSEELMAEVRDAANA